MKIRSKLRSNEDFKGEEAFWFTLPSVDAHKYHKQEKISEPLDPVVRSKIKELVHEGKRNALVISKLLEIFVTKDLKQNDRKRRRFFPDIPTIKRIIKGRRDICRGKKNTEKLLETYNKNDSFICPSTEETISDDLEELEERESKRKLINECNSHMGNLAIHTWDLKQNDRKRRRFSPDIHIIKEGRRDICHSKKRTDKILETYNENDSFICSSTEETVSDEQLEQLEERESKRRKLINECNSHMGNLGLVMWMLPECALLELKKDLIKLTKKIEKI